MHKMMGESQGYSIIMWGGGEHPSLSRIMHFLQTWSDNGDKHTQDQVHRHGVKGRV